MSTLTRNKAQIIQQNKILVGGQTISLRARQLIYVLASRIDRDNPHAEILINAKDFLAFINNNSKRKWRDVYSTTYEIFDELNDNPILLKKTRGRDFERINWLSSLGVKQGMIKARFSADISEYFIYRKGLPYTKLLWDLRGYKSSFTARILDLFQRFHIKEHGQDEIQFEYDLEELKLFFGVHKKYSRPNDFKKRVLDVAKEELEQNDLAPYWFEYSNIKQGRKVVKIGFTVYVRSQRLLELLPNLNFQSLKDQSQPSLFSENKKLTDYQNEIITLLVEEQGLKEPFARNVISKLTEVQGKAYYLLVRYGVNRSLAFTIVERYCSFGELKGYEDKYVLHSLTLLEEARIKRIQEDKKSKKKMRTTPKNKRGGLAKRVFEERQYFPSFMEKLSDIRKQEIGGSHSKRRNDVNSLGDLIKDIKHNTTNLWSENSNLKHN